MNHQTLYEKIYFFIIIKNNFTRTWKKKIKRKPSFYLRSPGKTLRNVFALFLFSVSEISKTKMKNKRNSINVVRQTINGMLMSSYITVRDHSAFI